MLCFPVSTKERLTSSPLQTGKTESLNFVQPCKLFGLLLFFKNTEKCAPVGHILRGCVWRDRAQGDGI